jgi:hypothetical protein
MGNKPQMAILRPELFHSILFEGRFCLRGEGADAMTSHLSALFPPHRAVYDEGSEWSRPGIFPGAYFIEKTRHERKG